MICFYIITLLHYFTRCVGMQPLKMKISSVKSLLMTVFIPLEDLYCNLIAHKSQKSASVWPCHSLRNIPITQTPAHVQQQAALGSCLPCPA